MNFEAGSKYLTQEWEGGGDEGRFVKNNDIGSSN